MDWTVYWFMLPVCIAIAGVAIFSGISGAALLIPVFLIGFPLLGVPRLGTVEAVGTSLLLEAAGFGTGVYRYLHLRLVDIITARGLIVLTLPLGAAGAISSTLAPVQALRLGYGVAMLALAWMLSRETKGVEGDVPSPGIISHSDSSHPDCGQGAMRRVEAANGTIYSYCAHGLGLQRVFSGIGAFIAGMISTGVGEATLPPLVRRSRFPVAVAAATSTLVVAGTVVGAAATHMVQLVSEGGLAAIPWDLIVWAVPGAAFGAMLGTRLQGKVSEKKTRIFFTVLFAIIGLSFVLAFTVFSERFA